MPLCALISAQLRIGAYMRSSRSCVIRRLYALISRMSTYAQPSAHQRSRRIRQKIYPVRQVEHKMARQLFSCRCPEKTNFRQMQEILVQKEPATYDFWAFHVSLHMKCKIREKIDFRGISHQIQHRRLKWSLFNSKSHFLFGSCDYCDFGLSCAYTRSPAHVSAHYAHDPPHALCARPRLMGVRTYANSRAQASP